MESIDFLTDNTHSTLDCSPIVALCWPEGWYDDAVFHVDAFGFPTR